MRALVLGCGSIGLRHLQHLRRLGVEEIEAADPDPAARDRVKARLGIGVESDSDRALSRRPDVVLVCTPAATHIPVTLKALQAGAHVFVEKPLSTSLEGTELLLERIRSDGRIVQVGYLLRYHPAIRAAKGLLDSGCIGQVLTAHAEFGFYLKRWWPGRDYRASYMADDALGGGLLLDVSHEIELLSWFLGRIQEVAAYGARLSRLEIPGMDVIQILMRMQSGALATLRMDCLQPIYTRAFTLVGEGSGLRWSCRGGRADASLGRLQLCECHQQEFQDVPVAGDPAEIYLDELRDFFSCVRERRSPAVGVEEAVEILRVVAAIQRSMQDNRSVRV